MSQRSFIIIFAIILVVFWLAIVKTRLVTRNPFESPLVGEQLPEFRLARIDNHNGLYFTNLDIKNDDAEYKILNFFASWCVSCRLEHNSLIEISTLKNVEIYGVAWKDVGDKVDNWLKTYGNPYTIVALDMKGTTKFKFSLIGIPETLIIDKNNVVIAHFRGPVTFDTVAKIIE